MRTPLFTSFLTFLFFLSVAPVVHGQTLPPVTAITAESVFELTNETRGENGRPPLLWDDKLVSLAEEKLDDMFLREYFGHIDPEGKTAGAHAKAAGYRYSLFGENLAMGWYDDTDMLVDAWMESSGHRKNMLHEKFTSIGIAVDIREFEGEQTLIAIQLFAHPASVCTKPSSELAKVIATHQAYAQRLNEFLNTYIKGTSGASNRSVRVLTNQVTAVMSVFLRELDSKVRTYNAQVEKYDACRRGT